MSELAALERSLREKGVKCFSIRLEEGRVRVNYRTSENRWEWKDGKTAPNLHGALVNYDFIADEPPASSDLEDLLG